MITVLLADDEHLIRGALASLLTLEDDITVVAQAGTGDEALAMAVAHRPDVAVLDLQMPGLDGIGVATRLRESVPGCASMIVTSHARAGALKRALSVGCAASCPRRCPRTNWPRSSARCTPAAATSTRNSPPTPSPPANHP